MHCLVGIPVLGGTIVWQGLSGPFAYPDEEGVFLNFPLGSGVVRRSAFNVVEKLLAENEITWLVRADRQWQLNLDELKQFAIQQNLAEGQWNDAAWMTGIISVEPDIETDPSDSHNGVRNETSVQFLITREDIELAVNKRIFLSHKSIDKPLVHRTYDILKLLGFEPWLDKEDMNAGVDLDRALLRGMKESCAAVFFLTPDYVDDNFLAAEVSYAIAEERAKGNDFKIISLVLQKKEVKGTVPDLLRRFVWKEPENELDLLSEILKALPLRVGEVRREEAK